MQADHLHLTFPHEQPEGEFGYLSNVGYSIELENERKPREAAILQTSALYANLRLTQA